MELHRLAPLLTGLVLQAGCGLAYDHLVGDDRPDPIVPGRPPDTHIDDEPPTAFSFTGEIRDYATFRREPAAGLEFWSEDPEYVPQVTMDGQGGFSAWVETCLQRTSNLEKGVDRILLPGTPPTCKKGIGSFALRARLGSRCSAPFGSVSPSLRDPRVLWLYECAEPRSGARLWRPISAPSEPPR